MIRKVVCVADGHARGDGFGGKNVIIAKSARYAISDSESRSYDGSGCLMRLKRIGCSKPKPESEDHREDFNLFHKLFFEMVCVLPTLCAVFRLSLCRPQLQLRPAIPAGNIFNNFRS